MILLNRLLGMLAAVTALMACSRGSVAAAADRPDTQGAGGAVAVRDSLAWLVVDSAASVVSLELHVTAPAGAPSALINGQRSGGARITVPVGWTIRWNWRSADSAASHSLVVMVQREKMPLEGGRASFSNAMTRMVTEGLQPGTADQSSFEAEEAGWYWMLCGVPGHAVAGEWIELRVDPEARTARGEIRKG